MLQALGLVETKGLIGAIEAADAMAKAANVKIIEKEKITAGFVTIKILGDVAAVKSAVEAGAAAAQKVGQLVSTHVIPSPHSDLHFLISESIIPESDLEIVYDEENKNQFDFSAFPRKKAKKVVKEEISNSSEVENVPPVDDSVNEEETLFTSAKESDHLIRLKQEAKKELAKELPAEEDENYSKEEKDELKEFSKQITSIEQIDNLNVHELRHLARSFEAFPIKGREISKANREVLYNYFKEILK